MENPRQTVKTLESGEKQPDGIAGQNLQTPPAPVTPTGVVTLGGRRRVIRRVAVLEPSKITKLGLDKVFIQAVNKLQGTERSATIKEQVLPIQTRRFSKPQKESLESDTKKAVENNSPHPQQSHPTGCHQEIVTTENKEPLSKSSSSVEIKQSNESRNAKLALRELVQKRAKLKRETRKNSFCDASLESESTTSSCQSPNIVSVPKRRRRSVKVATPEIELKQVDELVECSNKHDNDFVGFTSDEIKRDREVLKRLEDAISKCIPQSSKKIPPFDQLTDYLKKKGTPERSRGKRTVQNQGRNLTKKQELEISEKTISAVEILKLPGEVIGIDRIPEVKPIESPAPVVQASKEKSRNTCQDKDRSVLPSVSNAEIEEEKSLNACQDKDSSVQPSVSNAEIVKEVYNLSTNEVPAVTTKEVEEAPAVNEHPICQTVENKLVVTPGKPGIAEDKSRTLSENIECPLVQDIPASLPIIELPEKETELTNADSDIICRDISFTSTTSEVPAENSETALKDVLVDTVAQRPHGLNNRGLSGEAGLDNVALSLDLNQVNVSDEFATANEEKLETRYLSDEVLPNTTQIFTHNCEFKVGHENSTIVKEDFRSEILSNIVPLDQCIIQPSIVIPFQCDNNKSTQDNSETAGTAGLEYNYTNVSRPKRSDKGIVVLDQQIIKSEKPFPSSVLYSNLISNLPKNINLFESSKSNKEYVSKSNADGPVSPIVLPKTRLNKHIEPVNHEKSTFHIKPNNSLTKAPAERTILVKVLKKDPQSNDIQIEIVDPILKPPKKVVDPIKNICKSYVRKMMKSSGIKKIKINSPKTDVQSTLRTESTKGSNDCDSFSIMAESPVKPTDCPGKELPSVVPHVNLLSARWNDDLGLQQSTLTNSMNLDRNDPIGTESTSASQPMDAVEYILNCTQNSDTVNRAMKFEDEDWAMEEWQEDNFDNAYQQESNLSEFGQNDESSDVVSIIESAEISFEEDIKPTPQLLEEMRMNNVSPYIISTYQSSENAPKLTPSTFVKTEKTQENINTGNGCSTFDRMPFNQDAEDSNDCDSAIVPPKKRKRVILNCANTLESTPVDKITERIRQRLIDKGKFSETLTPKIEPQCSSESQCASSDFHLNTSKQAESENRLESPLLITQEETSEKETRAGENTQTNSTPQVANQTNAQNPDNKKAVNVKRTGSVRRTKVVPVMCGRPRASKVTKSAETQQASLLSKGDSTEANVKANINEKALSLTKDNCDTANVDINRDELSAEMLKQRETNQSSTHLQLPAETFDLTAVSRPAQNEVNDKKNKNELEILSLKSTATSGQTREASIDIKAANLNQDIEKTLVGECENASVEEKTTKVKKSHRSNSRRKNTLLEIHKLGLNNRPLSRPSIDGDLNESNESVEESSESLNDKVHTVGKYTQPVLDNFFAVSSTPKVETTIRPALVNNVNLIIPSPIPAVTPRRRGRPPKKPKMQVNPILVPPESQYSETMSAFTSEYIVKQEQPDQYMDTFANNLSTSNLENERKLVADCYFHPMLLVAKSRDEMQALYNFNETEANQTLCPVSSDSARCGVCKDVFFKKDFKHHLIKDHFGVGWRMNEDPPINVTSYREILNVMNGIMKQHKITSLECKACNVSKKSAAGMITHLWSCLLTAEQLYNMQETCEFCDKRYLPVALWTHSKTCKRNPVFDNITVVEASDEPNGSKRKSAIKAKTSLKSIALQGDSFSPDDLVKQYQCPPVAALLLKWKAFLKKYGVAKCSEDSCNFETPDIEIMKKHYKDCIHIRRGGYKCVRCNFYSALERTVREHVSSEHVNMIIANAQDSQSVAENDVDEFRKSASESESEGEFPEPEQREVSLFGRSISYTTPDYSVIMKKMLSKLHSDDVLFRESGMPRFEFSLKSFANFQPIRKRSIRIGFTLRTDELNKHTGASQPQREWVQLKLFDTIDEKWGKCTFLGGSIVHMAWVPKNERETKRIEYLAIMYRRDIKSRVKLLNPQAEACLILIYKVDLSEGFGMKLLYGVECSGPVHHFVFLPSGGYAPEISRLGLLAVGLPTSNINIYALPLKAIDENCDNTIYDESNCKILDLKPCMRLCVDIIGKAQKDDSYKSPCTKVLWSEVKPHNIIVAGFANGFVGIWDVRDGDNLTRIDVDGDCPYFIPLSYFNPLRQSVTALAMHYHVDEPRWLVVASRDREFQAYDLEDITNPRPLVTTGFQKTGVSAAVWPMYAENPSMAMDDDYIEDTSGVYSASIYNITFKIKHHMHSPSGFVCLDFQPWHNALIGGCQNGDVVLQRFRTLSMECMVVTAFPRRYIFTSDVVRLDGAPIPSNSPDTVKNMTKDILPYFDTYNEKYDDSFGLVFGGPAAITRNKNKLTTSVERATPLPLRCLTKVNSIAACPNMYNTQLVAIGYNSGFLRILLLNYNDYR